MDRSPDASVATTSLNLFLGKDDFSYDEVDPEARETCNNWFYKIASIRELLPRFFVELSVMKCLRFVQPKDAYSREFMRLAKSTRGIGHPLVSVYARAYLAKKVILFGKYRSTFFSHHRFLCLHVRPPPLPVRILCSSFFHCMTFFLKKMVFILLAIRSIDVFCLVCTPIHYDSRLWN